MTTIYRKNAGRLTVAEAKRLVCEAVPKEPAVDFFVAPDGSIKVEVNHEANTAAPFINADFLDACGKLGINPRMTHRPVIAGYTGDGYQDVMYSITHDEFVRYADLHGVAVNVGEAPSVGQAHQPEPAPAPATAALVEQPQGAAQVEPVQRSAAQDAAILDAIREAGHDPLALPKNDSGKRGIKAVIRDKLKGTHALFPKVGTQFDKAWERLRARKEIADSE